jgi:hypothetical protein
LGELADEEQKEPFFGLWVRLALQYLVCIPAALLVVRRILELAGRIIIVRGGVFSIAVEKEGAIDIYAKKYFRRLAAD